jgi:hypothetical protein
VDVGRIEAGIPRRKIAGRSAQQDDPTHFGPPASFAQPNRDAYHPTPGFLMLSDEGRLTSPRKTNSREAYFTNSHLRVI